MEPEIQSQCKINCVKSRIALKALMIIVIGIIIVVVLTRDKIVDGKEKTVSVTGRGQVFYQPDTANVTLGVQVDKSPTAKQALDDLNSKVSQIITALTAGGTARADIATQNYSLTTQYDYKDGTSVPAGYNANQRIMIKVRNVQINQQKISQVLATAEIAGSNQVVGVVFDASNLNDLRQEARLAAIKDARDKSGALAAAAGIKLDKVVGWRENQSGGSINPVREFSTLNANSDSKAISQPDVPTGTQDIVIDVNLDYEVR